MMALVVVAMGTIAGANIWAPAMAAKDVELDRAGTYHVWIYAPADGAASIAVDSKALDVEKPAKREDKYKWFKAGTVELAAGRHNVDLGNKVAFLVLTRNAEYAPQTYMGDAYAFDRPISARDARAERVLHTDTVFTMPEFRSKAEWETLAARLRKRMLLGSGLMPMPEKTPLNAVISPAVEHPDDGTGGYSIAKVSFEARPGLLVTGNLYRPLGKQGPFPGIVNPHGHWSDGRFANEELGSVPARCITFARMGMVAFSYDMTGYVDSKQFEHRWGGEKEKLWGLHPFALQLWASERAVDFIESLPDVDKDRIGCTGASGGGTQTFALTAIEPRIKVSAPVNMISHSMQGGCLCENAPIIRLENSNMEIAALTAPRPMLMVAATGDWTRETLRVEFPSIQSIYRLYDAQDKVETTQVDAGHNYNKLSREAVYRFMGNNLLGGGAEKWANYQEPPFTLDKSEDMRVFADGKLPESLPKKDAVIAGIIKSTQDKWRAVMPMSQADIPGFREQYGDVLALTLGAVIPQPNDFDAERVGYEERRDKGCVVERWVLRRAKVGDGIPAILYRGYDPTPQDAVLLVHGQGKAALADFDNGGPGPLVAALIAQGKAVLTIDAFLLGEHHSPFEKTTRKRQGVFLDTFMPTDTGYRVQDVLTSLAWLRSRRDMTGNVDLAGLNAGGMWCMLAAAIDGRVGKLAVDANGFNPDDDEAWVEKYYIPCIRAIGDIDTAAVMVAPKPMFVFNAAATFRDGIESAYASAGTPSAASLRETEADPQEMAAWLAK